MKKTRPPKSKPSQTSQSFFQKEGLPLLVLTLSLFICFKDWLHLQTKIFLSLDLTVIYYPLFHWVHDHLTQGRLPLISDWAYHGAPVAAVSMVGVLSPVLGFFHLLSSFPLLFNLSFLFPFFMYVFGAYFLGRELKLSSGASILLAFLWGYNGHQMAQLDHLNVAWAHAFFPWAFLALLHYLEQNKFFWLLLASLLWGLNLFSGHPQVFFLEGLFFIFWALFYPSQNLMKRSKAVSQLALGAFVFASPLILFTGECLGSDGTRFEWSAIDRTFHSWTPANFITLIFPWFFGRDSYDRQGSDYWWQYQFVEMQVAFSVVGLFFILLFFHARKPQTRWLGATALFGLFMAFGKFLFVYPLIQSLPFFSLFRDPARYWFLATWALGLGAAYAWDEWFEKNPPLLKGRRLSLGLLFLSVFFIFAGWVFLTWGQSLLQSLCAWMIQHFLLGDSLHTQPLTAYLDRLPEKLGDLAINLNPQNFRIYLPLIILVGLAGVVAKRKTWNLSFQKSLLLVLVFVDLMAFRMPLGNSFYSPSDIPQTQLPAAANRTLPLIFNTNSPLPAQYGEFAFPNMNWVSGRACLPFDANPALGRYNELSSRLGWFSWVYKDRDYLGFTHRLHLMRALGLDQVISDTSLKLPKAFKTVRKESPFVYSLSGIQPKAFLVDQVQIAAWPGSIDLFESPDFNSSRKVILDSSLDFPLPADPAKTLPSPQINRWNETRISLTVETTQPSLLVLQKTFLPGWKARVNDAPVKPLRGDFVLTAIPLSVGAQRVELSFEPVSLRLGFFFFLVFCGTFGFFLLRRLLESL